MREQVLRVCAQRDRLERSESHWYWNCTDAVLFYTQNNLYLLTSNLLNKCNYKPTHTCSYSTNDLGRWPRSATDLVIPAGSAASRLDALYIYSICLKSTTWSFVSMHAVTSQTCVQLFKIGDVLLILRQGPQTQMYTRAAQVVKNVFAGHNRR